MKPAVRNGVTLLILLLAVFPCGAALTVLGTILIKLVRGIGAGTAIWSTIRLLAIPILRCFAGVLGFLSIIPSVDKLMVAQRRLAKREILGMLLGIFFATQFLISYLLHLSALKVFRVVCVGPIAIELFLLVYHLARCGKNSNAQNSSERSPQEGFSDSEREPEKDLTRH